jgi:hypothetical protein
MITILLLAVNLTLTPGVVRTDLNGAQICSIRWGKDHRFVTLAMRKEVFRRYGIPWADHRLYEVDHLIPRELGGSDNLLNLWPQIWPDAHKKDKAENAARRAVCEGRTTIAVAQEQMRRWK